MDRRHDIDTIGNEPEYIDLFPLGFEQASTGGGCMAWMKQTDYPNAHIMVTATDDPSLPQAGQPMRATVLNRLGRECCSTVLNSIEELQDWLRDHMRPFGAAILANQFSIELNRALTPQQIAETNLRNAFEENPNICHSHDFCDANVVMLDAAHALVTDYDDEGESIDNDLFDAAWEIARAAEFKPRPFTTSEIMRFAGCGESLAQDAIDRNYTPKFIDQSANGDVCEFETIGGKLALDFYDQTPCYEEQTPADFWQIHTNLFVDWE